MAKDKKKKKDRNSADTHRSGAETATTDVTDAAGGGNLAANSLVSNADNSSEKMADAISNALTEVVPEITESKTVDQSNFEEPVLTKLILEHYTGEKEYGLYHGDGEAKFVGGHSYKGMFNKGKMHGRGLYTWSDGVTYEGDFTDNHITGKGLYRWIDGSSYEGEVFNGLRHGNGTFTCPRKGLCYTGQWYKGKRHGNGILYYDSMQQSVYEGEWFCNMKNGRGYRRYPSGNVYDGMWYRDKRHGYGTMRWHDRNNETYEGDWEDGLQHGVGEHTWFLRRLPGSQYPQRNQYYGQWHKGLRQGTGTFTYANGSKYEGQWHANQKHGNGVVTFKNGRVFEGQFENDKMVQHPEFTMDGLRTPDIGELRTRSADRENAGIPDDASITSEMSVSAVQSVAPSFSLDLEQILLNFPEEKREEESLQINFCVLRNISLLRKIYTFYSKLCKDNFRGPASAGAGDDNTFVMDRLQFWRFLKDIHINEHDITVIEVDRLLGAFLPSLLSEDSGDGQNSPHQPNSKFLFLDFVNSLVVISFNVFFNECRNDKNVVASCLSKFLERNVKKNACKVKGSLLADRNKAKIAMDYLDKVCDLYIFICRPLRVQPKNFPNDVTVNARDVLHMLSDFKLINDRLSSKVVLQVLAADDPRVYDGDNCNVELELTLLEFIECLLTLATIYVTDEVLKEPPPATPQITVAVAGANGRTSTLASEELAETVFTGMDANSKLALLQGTSPSQISQIDNEEEEYVGEGGAAAEESVNIAAEQNNETAASQAGKSGRKSTLSLGVAAATAAAGGTGSEKPNDVLNSTLMAGESTKAAAAAGEGDNGTQRSGKADEELALGITDDPVVSASRPVTRVPSNMTSARSSRFVDWGGVSYMKTLSKVEEDTEDEIEDLPRETKLWAQQVKCFFSRKLFPAFDHACRIKAYSF